jgi:hypothetical protein
VQPRDSPGERQPKMMMVMMMMMVMVMMMMMMVMMMMMMMIPKRLGVELRIAYHFASC